ncbi:uncharacterized protein K452DRAFT_312008 [Aplosporella prunicola CBS 121167]|uniref:Uncharacterized protein n=1 Tax=Aplosporella prunicola CBS 121167 TaxID=1176127 RepID=A0A6A6B131_9PEZI|nr:uncharacterized protein K452DRAFT_312008 [Aplosporella prunicola CBS 121167]KAF2137869.1 hypothetical protein K452DRAFT_312008 [Aplosporella prunicola CBS 121167]
MTEEASAGSPAAPDSVTYSLSLSLSDFTAAMYYKPLSSTTSFPPHFPAQAQTQRTLYHFPEPQPTTLLIPFIKLYTENFTTVAMAHSTHRRHVSLGDVRSENVNDVVGHASEDTSGTTMPPTSHRRRATLSSLDVRNVNTEADNNGTIALAVSSRENTRPGSHSNNLNAPPTTGPHVGLSRQHTASTTLLGPAYLAGQYVSPYPVQIAAAVQQGHGNQDRQQTPGPAPQQNTESDGELFWRLYRAPFHTASDNIVQEVHLLQRRFNAGHQLALSNYREVQRLQGQLAGSEGRHQRIQAALNTAQRCTQECKRLTDEIARLTTATQNDVTGQERRPLRPGQADMPTARPAGPGAHILRRRGGDRQNPGDGGRYPLELLTATPNMMLQSLDPILRNTPPGQQIEAAQPEENLERHGRPYPYNTLEIFPAPEGFMYYRGPGGYVWHGIGNMPPVLGERAPPGNAGD